MKTLQFFSLATFPIELFSSTGKCGNATGFFYSEDKDNINVITNWHVVTGRNPSKPSISEYGTIPIYLKGKVHKKISGEKYINRSMVNEFSIKINDEDGSKPIWLEHPIHKYNADVVVIKIPINEMENSKIETFVSYRGFESQYIPSAMDDVFVIGYPWSLTGGSPVLPIYKRGSIASEPIVNFKGNIPSLLIDCRTSKGLSGAPALVSHSGYWKPENGEAKLGTVTNFLGIYSGRLIGQENDISEIGIVWKQIVIDEIITNGIPGTKLHDLIS